MRHNRNLWAYSFYDFANSGYLLIFGTFLFPILFRENVGGARADLLWGALLTTATAIGMVVSPLVGHIADRHSRRTVLIITISFMGASVLGLSLLIALQLENWLLLAAAFICSHIGYVVSISVYDSYLAHLAPEHERAQFSSFAWGFGYLGGIVCLVLAVLAAGKRLDPEPPAFIVTAIFFLAFATLSLILLPRDFRVSPLRLREVSNRVVSRHTLVLLLGFWLVNEAIVTITFFTSLFGRETLGLSVARIGMIYFLVQILAFPGTWLMGRVARRYGKLPTIMATIVVWIGVLLYLAWAESFRDLVILSIVSAFVIGSTQALMRALFAGLFPEEISGFTFGLFTVASRFAAVIGPLAFGVIADLLGNQRIAIGTTLIPLIAGGILLFTQVPRATTAARG